MTDRSRVAAQLSGKRIYASDGVPLGKAMLIAECGRVMAVEDIINLPPDLLRLVDTVCVNHDDPLNPKLRERPDAAPTADGDAPSSS